MITAPSRGILRALHDYSYVIAMGVSSLVVMGKSYLFSFLFTESAFADFNYYLISLSATSIVVPLGFMLRSQVDLPARLQRGDQSQVDRLTALTKASSLLVSVLMLCGAFVLLNSAPVLLGILQGFLYAVFFADQQVIKSRLEMWRYVNRILARNALIAIAGLGAFYAGGDVAAICLAEVLCGTVLCLALGNFQFRWPQGLLQEIWKDYGYFGVCLLGLGISTGERVVAGSILTEVEFSTFSYFYLLVLVTVTLQQFINARFIAEVSLLGDFRRSLWLTLKTTILTGAICLVFVFATLFFLQFNTRYFDAVEPATLFTLCLLAIVRGGDFVQTIFIVFTMRMHLSLAQTGYLVGLAGMTGFLIMVGSEPTLSAFLIIALAASIGLYVYLATILVLKYLGSTQAPPGQTAQPALR